MKKSKTVLVTTLVAAMFSVIYGGLFLLYKPGFTILTILLTVYGFTRGVSDFHSWLNEDAPVKPVTVSHADKPIDRAKRPTTYAREQNRRPAFDIPLDEPFAHEVRR